MLAIQNVVNYRELVRKQDICNLSKLAVESGIFCSVKRAYILYEVTSHFLK